VISVPFKEHRKTCPVYLLRYRSSTANFFFQFLNRPTPKNSSFLAFVIGRTFPVLQFLVEVLPNLKAKVRVTPESGCGLYGIGAKVE
jgi:hypothetical protein